MPAERCFSFEGFQLDLGTGRLSGDAGPIALAPKALAVLEYLAARPGQLVSKDELLSALWPGVFLGDSALKVCVSEIRRALGDDAQEPADHRDRTPAGLPVHCARDGCATGLVSPVASPTLHRRRFPSTTREAAT